MKQEAAPCLSSSSSSSTTDNLSTTAMSSHSSSSLPSRILSINNNTWVDIPDQLFQKLRDGFSSSKPIRHIESEGIIYTFDFHKMVQIDSHTGAENPIAWIDVHGQCFFPITPTNSDETSITPKFSGAEELKEDDKLYKVVEKLFTNGMKRDGANIEVRKVYKCMYSSDLEKMRLKTFHMTSEMMKAVRGDANVRFGWYGGSSEDVAAAVKHGFGRCNDGGHGVGVHLSSPHFPCQTSMLSEEDENEERHIVLCRVIMGRSERVEAGSSQCYPSNNDHDSGVDDYTNPKWYVVWSNHMNTHILPEYIVTFKAARKAAKFMRKRQAVVSGLCFEKLLVEMGGYLPAAELRSLEAMYHKYKSGRVSKDEFIRHLRTVAGDKLLASSIRKIRGC